jgi:hypothetical protein
VVVVVTVFVTDFGLAIADPVLIKRARALKKMIAVILDFIVLLRVLGGSFRLQSSQTTKVLTESEVS